MRPRTRLLPAMFCLGAFALQAQVLFTREALVVFHGNELSIGAVLSGWLFGIAVGAILARAALRVLVAGERSRRVRFGVALVLSILFPIQVHLIRTARIFLHVPVGEYVPLGAILGAEFVVFLPTALAVGLYFPLACHELATTRTDGAGGRAVSRVYMMEALGSMVAGMALTFAMLPFLDTGCQIAIVVLLGLTMAIISAPSTSWRTGVMAMAVVPLIVLFWPGAAARLESVSARARWRAFGVMGPQSESRWVDSRDSRYQNLALLETQGQYVLYANGEIASVFPDPLSYEHTIHVVMAQKPRAQSVLLLGGNPVGDVPELLKYPVERVVCVDLDPVMGEMIHKAMPEAYNAVTNDPRVTIVAEDGPRYVRRCRDLYDVVLIRAPDPNTASANRFYTLEFYREVRRVLAPGGFMTTTIRASERLQDEAARVGASIYGTLREVFPVVRVTAETPNRFYAGDETSGLTFDRSALRERSASIPRRDRFFRPEYFLGADEIDPEKMANVVRRFVELNAPLNTSIRPVAYFDELVLWARFSGSACESVLRRLRGLGVGRIVQALLLAGVLAMGVGALVGVRGRRCSAESSGSSRLWVRLMVAVIIGTTGFCGIAMELLLIFVFQNALGYVYARIGMIIAIFMFGLVAGAPSGRFLADEARRARLGLIGIELLLLVLALLTPRFARAALAWESSWAALWVEGGVYGLVWLVGWAVGAEFPIGNRLFRDAGGTLGAAAAVTDACDHMGAAMGALTVGVVLIPVLGVDACGAVLAALKAFGLLALVGVLAVVVQTPGMRVPQEAQAPLTRSNDSR